MGIATNLVDGRSEWKMDELAERRSLVGLRRPVEVGLEGASI